MSLFSPNAPGDQAAIAANRYGQFTPWQLQQLRPPRLVGALVLLGLSGTFFVPVGFYFVFQLVRTLTSSDSPAFLTWIYLGLLCLFLLVLVPLLIFPVMGLRDKLRLRRDLAEQLIAQEDGQVVFTRSFGYSATASGRRFFSIDGSKAVSLSPGAYRFYYLPRTRRLLSAERQPFFGPGGPEAGVRHALAEAHGFQMDELDTNRQGSISRGQRSRLVGRLMFLAIIVVAGLGWVIWQFALVLQYAPWSFLGLAVFLLITGALTHDRWLDLLDGRAAMLEGYVQAVEESSDDSSSYYYVLDRQRFSVSSVGYKALVPGERYRLYYLPHSKKLLSVEPSP